MLYMSHYEHPFHIYEVRTPKRVLFQEVDLFPMSAESYIYFHTKEFFMLHKLAENSDISRREKSLTLEIYKHVKIL